MKEAFDHAAVQASTIQMMGAGIQHLQGHRFADGELAHAARLLRWAEVPANAQVVDLGSGMGGIAAHWGQMRNDLRFTLVNINEFQLLLSPKNCITMLCDMTEVPAGDGSFDMALALFSLGHGDLDKVFDEAGRILKDGGVFFVYDMVSDGEQGNPLAQYSYDLHTRKAVEAQAKASGFLCDFYMEPTDTKDLGKKLPEIVDIFGRLQPAIWRFIKDVANDV